MTEPLRRIQEAGRLLTPAMEPADTERALARFWALDERRRQRRVIGASAAVGLSMVFGAIWLTSRPEETAAPVMVAKVESDERVIRFADGSVAVLLSEGTVLRVEESSEALMEIALQTGRARFDVAPNPNRLFRVVTKGLRVEVLGTSFTVDDEALEQVTVHRGRVAVFAGDNRHELAAGMTFALEGERAVVGPGREPDGPDEELLSGTEDPPTETPSVRRPAKKKKPGLKKARAERTASSWRHLAEKGLFAEAYEALEDQDDEGPIADLRGLLLAADVARLSGHPAEAAGYLETALREHQKEGQAVLAAFTLGRIYERELSKPERAAEAFAVARSLEPGGSLAEDALAHEIDCWSKAGQDQKAKERARLYLQLHPEGRRAARLRGMVQER